MNTRTLIVLMVGAATFVILLQVIGCLDIHLHAAPQRSPPKLKRENDVQVVLAEHDVGGARCGHRLGAATRGRAGTGRSAPTIEQVRELSALVTMSVDVVDVQVSDVRGWTGGVRVALLVRGQYLLGTDLGAGRFESVDHGARTAVLVLPPPTATHPRLDHDRAKLYAVSPYGLWGLVPSGRAEVAAVNSALLAAQDSLAAAGGAHEAVERARRQAEAVMTCFFRAIEWEVTVRWSDRP